MLDVLLVDDDPLARKRLSMLLREHTNIEHLYEAGNGEEAMTLVQQFAPRLAFLDVDMPVMNGLELAEHIYHRCEVIFVSGHDQYATEAFALDAADYLLKPVSPERLQCALEKALKRIIKGQYAEVGDVLSMVNTLRTDADSNVRQRILVRDAGRILVIDCDDISHIAGAGNYCHIHLCDGRSVLHRETLQSMFSQLDKREFVRVHRSTIVRRKSVMEMRTGDTGDYLLNLRCGTVLKISRRNRDKCALLLT